jgi:hypothetical protein
MREEKNQCRSTIHLFLTYEQRVPRVISLAKALAADVALADLFVNFLFLLFFFFF